MKYNEQKLYSWIILNNRWDLVEENGITDENFESVFSFKYWPPDYRKKRDEWLIAKAESDFDKEFFKMLSDYYDKYGKMPSTYYVADRMEDKTANYFEFVDVSKESFQELFDAIRLNGQDKPLYALCNAIIEFNREDDMSDKTQSRQRTQELLRVVCDMQEKNESLPFSSNFEKGLIDLYIERADPLQSAKHFFPTGCTDLDSVFKGWDKDSDYVTVAGRPGTGKSMMLTMFAAKQLVLGKRVAFYSGEMSENQVVERIISCITSLSLTEIYHGTLTPKNQELYFNFIKENLKKMNLFILTPEHLYGKYATARNLEGFCKKVSADILFIDQQSLMEDMDHAKVQYERCGNVSRQIKAMRDRLNIPIITAVQLNRTKTENGNSDTVQIAGSDVIAQDSTKVLILTKSETDGKIRLDIVKNRSGASYGKFLYDSAFEICNFKNSSNDLVFDFGDMRVDYDTTTEGNVF